MIKHRLIVAVLGVTLCVVLLPCGLALADPVPVQWDTVMSHANMFHPSLEPEGECVALVVSNHGEMGYAGVGGVNLDYRESGFECGPRPEDAVYLYSGSPFVITADDASGTNAQLTCSYAQIDQSESSWTPVDDLGPMTGGLAANGAYDSVYTGRMVNRDGSIAMERCYYAPRSADPANEIINFVVCYTKAYSADGQAHDHVTIGNLTDWNIPSEEININHSVAVSWLKTAWILGTDTTGVSSCQINHNRFGLETLGGGYTSTQWNENNCVNEDDRFAFQNFIVRDQDILDEINSQAWWNLLSDRESYGDDSRVNQAEWFTFRFDHNLGAQDTLHYWTILLTERNVTWAAVEIRANYARGWYYEAIRRCKLNCCIGIVGNANGVGDPYAPTIGDISVMIDALFVSADWNVIPCLDEADVNQSGGCYPTRADITIGDISVLIDYMYITGKPSVILPDCLVCPVEEK